MPSRDKQVFPSIVVEIVERGTKAGHLDGQVAQSARGRHFAEIAFAGVLEERKSLVVQSHKGDVRVAVIVEVAKIQPHPGNKLAAFRQRHARIECDLLEFAAEVMKEKIVFSIVRYEDILLAIEVVVGHADTHALADLIADAPFLRDVAKRPVSVIQEEPVRLTFVRAGMAVVGDIAEVAECLLAVAPLHVVDDKQIQQAVVVDIYPGSGFSPQRTVLWIVRIAQTCLPRHVGEGSIAIVAVERVAVHAGDKDVRAAIVVVIAHGYADVVARSGESRRIGHVGEGSIAVIPEKPIAILRIVLLQGCDVGAIGKENVRFTVAVVIEHCDSAGHAFGRIFSGRLIIFQDEGNFLQFAANGAGRGGGVEQKKRCGHQAQNDRRRAKEFGKGHAAADYIKKEWLSPPLLVRTWRRSYCAPFLKTSSA